jgi:hypothetical protein
MGDAPVRFHVTFDQEVLQDQLAGKEPILTTS